MFVALFILAGTADAAVLKMGSRGASVTSLQRLLISKGYLKTKKASGLFDASTKKAVIAFEKDNNQKEDGIAGQKVLDLLVGKTADISRGAPVGGVTVALSQYVTNDEAISTWPPVVKKSASAYACATGNTGGDMPMVTIQKKIGEETYCISKSSEITMGTEHRTYAYTAANGNGTKTTGFTLAYVGCSAWREDGTTKYMDCKASQSAFDAKLDGFVASLMR